ncbi:hypothetical protein BC567DRAFT_93457 [Phyllosticta citribraziliensis]
MQNLRPGSNTGGNGIGSILPLFFFFSLLQLQCGFSSHIRDAARQGKDTAPSLFPLFPCFPFLPSFCCFCGFSSESPLFSLFLIHERLLRRFHGA